MKNKEKVDELFQKVADKKKLTNEELIVCLISKQLEPFDKSYYDVLGTKSAWYNKHQVSAEQSAQWVDWGAEFIRKNAKSPSVRNKKRAMEEMKWIDLMWGLKVKGGWEAVEKYEKQLKENG